MVNQIKVVAFQPALLAQGLFLQKKQMLQNIFLRCEDGTVASKIMKFGFFKVSFLRQKPSKYF